MNSLLHLLQALYPATIAQFLHSPFVPLTFLLIRHFVQTIFFPIIPLITFYYLGEPRDIFFMEGDKIPAKLNPVATLHFIQKGKRGSRVKVIM